MGCNRSFGICLSDLVEKTVTTEGIRLIFSRNMLENNCLKQRNMVSFQYKSTGNRVNINLKLEWGISERMAPNMWKRWKLKGLVPLLFFVGCSRDINNGNDPAFSYHVSYNPYDEVDWSSWYYCLSQHHDHTRANEKRMRAYDDEEYNAVVILHYAGVKSLDYTNQERLWPLSKYLDLFDTDEEFLATTKNLRILIPSMEEVGRHHMTSAFLTKYIAVWEPDLYSTKEAWHYGDSQECIDLINEFGGFPIIAHPTRSTTFYLRLNDYDGIEIYNAFYAQEYRIGEHEEDLNNHFMELWDQLLRIKSTMIWGFAVNDWYGPFRKNDSTVFPEVYDSGKTLVMVKAYALEHYRDSIEKGAFFAVKDVGVEKRLYPNVVQINESEDQINIVSENGNVFWIFDGKIIHEGPVFHLAELPPDLNYVRAEIRNAFGTLYAQPFSLSAISKRN